MAIIPREISDRIRSLHDHFPCLVVTGARQVGKSTLLKELFPTYNYVSLDLPSEAEQADEDPESFFRRYSPPLLIDEVQYAPKLFRHLKTKIDAARHTMGAYILTGSQKFVLMKEVADSLAGRVAIVNLENLSLSELPLPDRKNPDWTSILHRGLYPELWRLTSLPTTSFYSSYVATYLERDVRQVLNVHNLRDFERFLRSCAVRSGQLLNLSDLARDVGIKTQTARDWLTVLEATNQISLLEPYFENLSKRFVKSPKLYLNDPGMLCFLLGLEQSNLSATPLIGNLWETLVYGEFRKRLSFSESSRSLWFYRDAQGREVDFLVMGGGKLSLYEAKWGDGSTDRWESNLEEVAKILSSSRTQQVGALSVVNRRPVKGTHGSVTICNPFEIEF